MPRTPRGSTSLVSWTPAWAATSVACRSSRSTFIGSVISQSWTPATSPTSSTTISDPPSKPTKRTLAYRLPAGSTPIPCR
uniref:Metalloendoproteinase 1-MMP n=1 Tax=Rhizophora mucronata TaxID=61149 RepID=A0A2P2PKD2_RHIMU